MIPFIRFYPNGKTEPESISRSPAIEHLAGKFHKAGGRYLITIHDSGEVELVAALAMTFGHIEKVAEATCSNDPVLPEAIDQLVRDSVDELQRRIN